MAASFHIKRISSLALFRAYKVELDGHVVANLQGGESAVMPIEEGEHSLVIGMDWCLIKAVSFSAKKDEALRFLAIGRVSG